MSILYYAQVRIYLFFLRNILYYNTFLDTLNSYLLILTIIFAGRVHEQLKTFVLSEIKLTCCHDNHIGECIPGEKSEEKCNEMCTSSNCSKGGTCKVLALQTIIATAYVNGSM